MESKLEDTGIKSRGNRSVVWRGAALMGVAMLMSKVIGTLQKIPLQNVAGDRVFGIYNAVYPFYQLLLVMVTAGFPVAVSLLVAQHEAVGDRYGSQACTEGQRAFACSQRLGRICFYVVWGRSNRGMDW